LPTGIGAVTITAIGGAGGNIPAENYPGGTAGYVSSSFTGLGDETLYINVGQAGSSDGSPVSANPCSTLFLLA
jgi:hypothetical protein